MPPDTLQNLMLAALQGFTEIFPISSSAHLAVYGRLVGQGISFEKVLFLHLGTFLAILYSCRKELAHLLAGKAGWSLPCRMLASFATTALVGLALEKMIVENMLTNSLVLQPQYVAGLWAVNGLLVGLVGILIKPGFRKMSDLSFKEYLVIGIAQGVSALPGISRLGLTLGAGLLQRMTWFEALKLSFLLSLPTILIANVFQLIQVLLKAGPSGVAVYNPGVSQVLSGVLIIATALGCGLLAIEFLSRFLGRRWLVYFGLYCFVAGSFFWLYLGLS